MTTKETFIQDMETKLAARQDEIDALKTKAESAGSGSKIDLEEKIAELELKQKYAQKTLAELQAAGESRWDRLQRSVASAWNDLDDAYREALAIEIA